MELLAKRQKSQFEIWLAKLDRIVAITVPEDFVTKSSGESRNKI